MHHGQTAPSTASATFSMRTTDSELDGDNGTTMLVLAFYDRRQQQRSKVVAILSQTTVICFFLPSHLHRRISYEQVQPLVLAVV